MQLDQVTETLLDTTSDSTMRMLTYIVAVAVSNHHITLCIAATRPNVYLKYLAPTTILYSTS